MRENGVPALAMSEVRARRESLFSQMKGLERPPILPSAVKGARRSYKATKPPHFCLVDLREGRASSDRLGSHFRRARIRGHNRSQGGDTKHQGEDLSPAERAPQSPAPLVGHTRPQANVFRSPESTLHPRRLRTVRASCGAWHARVSGGRSPRL